MESTSHFIWNVSPVLFKQGPIEIRWYGVLFALGFAVGLFIMRWVFQRENKPTRDLDSLLIHLVLGTLIGARLGQVIFYYPDHYFNNPWDILKIWEGGLASHGGVVGIFIALFIYQRKHKDQLYLWLIDRLSIPIALAAAFIRLGNLFNSEILGTPTSVSWALIFDRIDSIPRHPAQLYEAIAYALIAVILLLIYKKRGAHLKPGFLMGLLLVSVFTVRFFVEFIKERQASYEGDWALSVGQLLSLPVIALGLLLLQRRPKVVGQCCDFKVP